MAQQGRPRQETQTLDAELPREELRCGRRTRADKVLGEDELMTGSFQESVLGPGGESACLASQSTNTRSVHLIILTPTDSIVL